MTRQRNVLLTGGAGFFGDILKQELLSRGFGVVSVDLAPDDGRHDALRTVQGDIRDQSLLRHLAAETPFDAIFHVAAILAHAVRDRRFLWSSNVDGTRRIADLAREFGIPKVVFTSSNCLWGSSFHRPVVEEDEPGPVEIYGRSKLAAEQILLGSDGTFSPVVLRCPTIVDAGRLGLLAILFEFIEEGRKVWVVGGGENRYQFVYARDLVAACLAALDTEVTGVFNVGSDDVPTFRQAYQYVIDRAGTGARVASVPRGLAIPALRLAHVLRLSPLGPYQYKMIAEDFVFDTSKIRRELSWRPTLTNEQMLYEAYRYYADRRAEITARRDVSAHRRGARMGAIRLLKWVS